MSHRPLCLSQHLMLVLTVPLLLLSLTARATDLTSLVEQRLGYMQQVAAYKWHKELAIEHSQREAQLLEQVDLGALQAGVKPVAARRFFAEQMAAAREIQHYWFGRWKRRIDTPPPNPPDLIATIRPALNKLTTDILAALGAGDTQLGVLKTTGLSAATFSRLASAAAAVKPYPNRLAQVLDSGVLRVGTTGDYAPFSLLTGPVTTANPWSGIDIDLARNLATSLGAHIQWVHSSWPSLMDDLHAGLFDIGMSGISITLERQQTAFFSSAYHRGGKTPIVRCEDKAKYASLPDIDHPETRLVVNPGGTNEQYLRTNIKRAQVILHRDNRTIFGEIIDGNADVMITDLIEVQLQTGLHPELCPAMGSRTLTYSKKGFLLPQDIVWKEYVETWLDILRGDGTLENTFRAHL